METYDFESGLERVQSLTDWAKQMLREGMFGRVTAQNGVAEVPRVMLAAGQIAALHSRFEEDIWSIMLDELGHSGSKAENVYAYLASLNGADQVYEPVGHAELLVTHALQAVLRDITSQVGSGAAQR